MNIIDDFLNLEDLQFLESIIDNPFFPWFFQKEQVKDDSPYFCHILYCNDLSQSEFYPKVLGIFKNYIKWISLYRLNVNLSAKINSASNFHTDTSGQEDETKMTSAIFYLNTNNGYTEFEDGSTVDSVRNRFVTFPTNIPHRAVGQTDTDKRIVLNFNYIG
jgi:hypothetical protein